jgi:hypothetical protein
MIPKVMTYEAKKEAAGARRVRTTIAPQQGSATLSNPYAGGQTITINIPTGSNQMLIASESTLSFRLAITGSLAADIALESCGAHGIIQRLRLYHGLTKKYLNFSKFSARKCVSKRYASRM